MTQLYKFDMADNVELVKLWEVMSTFNKTARLCGNLT